VHGDVGEERERVVTWAGVVSFWMLVPLAVIGFRRLRRLHRVVVSLPILVVGLTTVVFYGGHRIRASAEPAIVVLAAVAFDGWSRRPSRITNEQLEGGVGEHDDSAALALPD
jgi:hypothetical protein